MSDGDTTGPGRPIYIERGFLADTEHFGAGADRLIDQRSQITQVLRLSISRFEDIDLKKMIFFIVISLKRPNYKMSSKHFWREARRRNPCRGTGAICKFRPMSLSIHTACIIRRYKLELHKPKIN